MATTTHPRGYVEEVGHGRAEGRRVGGTLRGASWRWGQEQGAGEGSSRGSGTPGGWRCFMAANQRSLRPEDGVKRALEPGRDGEVLMDAQA
jgi:hypothetical protein